MTGDSEWIAERSAARQELRDEPLVRLQAIGGVVLINPGYQFGMGVPLSFRINFSQDATRLFDAVDRIASVLDG